MRVLQCVLFGLWAAMSALAQGANEDILGKWSCNGTAPGAQFDGFSNYAVGRFSTTSNVLMAIPDENNNPIGFTFISNDRGSWKIVENQYLELTYSKSDYHTAKMGSVDLSKAETDAILGPAVDGLIGATIILKIVELSPDRLVVAGNGLESSCRKL